MEQKKLTGYPSVDKPWLKYYSEEIMNKELPQCTAYELLWQSNKEYCDNIALSYLGIEINFRDLFKNIEKTARAFAALGVKEGDIIVMVTVTIPETVYALYGLNMLGAIPNMVDPRTSAEGIKEYILEVNAKYVVILDAVYDKVIQIIDTTSVEHIVMISPANSLSAIKKKLYNLSQRSKKLKIPISVCWDTFIKQGQTINLDIISYKKNRCCLMVHTGGTTGILNV